MNVIDVGCSFIKSYVVQNDHVVNFERIPTNFDTLKEDTMRLFDRSARDHTQSSIVISTSDSVVWEDNNGNANWIEHQFPRYWRGRSTPYNKSGHPQNNDLKGAANQMREIEKIAGLKKMKRILPASTYIATLLADNPDWNGWDLTHATNSGFYDYDKAGWADEAQPFIDAGVIDAKIYPCDTLVEGNTFRRVFLGGHDSVFANANDIPYSTKPYISCGTWTTVSAPYDMERGIPDRGNARYIAAPNGVVLKQYCFPSDPDELDRSAKTIFRFFNDFERPAIKIFGSWSKEMYDILSDRYALLMDWIEPNRFWGCIHLPLQTSRYAKKSKHYVGDQPYFCEGA